jgi:hypothetical protein
MTISPDTRAARLALGTKIYTDEEIQAIMARTPVPAGTRAERRKRLLEALSLTEEDCAAFYRRAEQRRAAERVTERRRAAERR